ncbi:MAG: hypothetical protein HYX41_07845 [Bdellovibrio sp.]|nr:hypothetical protein [Bdellovibrio sp.]
MRFNLAWANTIAQNVTLKVALMVLSFVTVALTLSTAKLSIRKPIIIDRGCLTSVLEGSSNEHTTTEIETFVKEAIRQRFNSDSTPIPDYLSSEELAARSQEQKELLNRTMTQTVIVRAAKSNGNTVSVESDRLISVGQVRSAFQFPLIVTISSTTRSENNPYGLQVVKIIPPKTEQK